MPDFTYDTKEWKAMSFAFPRNPSPERLNVVGCAFGTKEYAHKFFDLLRSWNYYEPIDKDNNICLSFIIENEKQYSVYLYPNPERKTVEPFFKEMVESQKVNKFGKEPQELIMHIVFCKIFPYGKNSQLKKFLENQNINQPFWLKPFIMAKNGHLEMLYDEDPILKFHFKSKRREQLAKNEYEYHHGKETMKK